MVEVSRDGRRVYFTNSLYSAWDEQFYPDGIRSWMAKLNAVPQGGIQVDSNFFVEFSGLRPHQVRLDGGDAFVRLLLLLVSDTGSLAGLGTTALWVMFLLGAYHGINPAMGWLFAVALEIFRSAAVARWDALSCRLR